MSFSEQELTHTFHSSDLPLVSIPAQFDSNFVQSGQYDSSLIESDSDFVLRVSSTTTSILPSYRRKLSQIGVQPPPTFVQIYFLNIL